ncbi:MAG: PTS IIA-like nitrogen regulatory protein PtsN [Alysiella sp.]|uniref:PTS IIA-like nitrogen regulatory protein PtsN n=1 Tax=Alysiella sp. TaxID=1872483 RepID=UPI0026DCCCFD|nr:PTS IIA-like nitrogen regulatory protein PtsN [Alysiella sp.]MDO4433580.1 PTS IIA-like nitrogen regulatory protein PtsN [Alysiella sp.]
MKSIGEILPLSHIVLDMEISSKKRLFEEIGHLLADETHGLNANEIFDCLFARERLGTTGLGHGVAMPHGRHADVVAPISAFIRLKEAVDFDAPDGKPVSLVFILLVPEASTGEHLEILAHLAERFTDKTVRTALSECQHAHEVCQLLV